MTINPTHIVGPGGAIGALLRYAVNQQIENEAFPAGTSTVNVSGSFVLAALTFASVNDDVLLFLGTGMCGSFTTFSSFSFETVRLWETNDRPRATQQSTVAPFTDTRLVDLPPHHYALICE